MAEPALIYLFADSQPLFLTQNGDVALGWKSFQAVGLEEAIRVRHQTGPYLSVFQHD